MGIFDKLFFKLFKRKRKEQPWLAYYSRKDRTIKFTNKSIYNYMRDNVGDDLDFYAINYFGNRIRYYDFFKRVNLISKSLKFWNVNKGDIVSICMPNTPEAVEMFYACNKIGAVADMIHPLSAANEIKFYLNESKSRILMLYDANYEKVKDIIKDTKVEKIILVSVKESMPKMMGIGYSLTQGLKIKRPVNDKKCISWKEFINLSYSYHKKIKVSVGPKDLGVILHSGGTTGTPKGIMISNYSFNALAQQGGVNVYNARPKDKVVTILPIFHGFGLGVCVHCPLSLKVEAILVPEFNAKRFYKIMDKYHPNILAGVPTLWEAILNNKMFDKLDLSALKYVISGGDYLTVNMENQMNRYLRTHGAKISISKGYGMTESVAATAYTYDGSNEPGSIGIPMVGNEFCICPPESIEPLDFGEEGEICVNGPTVMMGYLNNKAETKKVLRRHKDGKIWLHTGDIGYIAPNGVIYFTQRLKRVIISSGFNVYPSAIEEVIERHPDVSKCCVISIPHQYKMHVPKAYIILKEGKSDSFKFRSEIKKLCKDNLAAYSQVKNIEIVDSLPKTLYNKFDYVKLEKEEQERYEKEKSSK